LDNALTDYTPGRFCAIIGLLVWSVCVEITWIKPAILPEVDANVELHIQSFRPTRLTCLVEQDKSGKT
jgi:ABC-type nitrate/sulfonate/bicarbonate transport system permease component